MINTTDKSNNSSSTAVVNGASDTTTRFDENFLPRIQADPDYSRNKRHIQSSVNDFHNGRVVYEGRRPLETRMRLDAKWQEFSRDMTVTLVRALANPGEAILIFCPGMSEILEIER